MRASKAERRLHPRILVNWPVVVHRLRNLSMEGETKDISVDGAFIECPEVPEISGAFELVLKPSERQSIRVTGEKVWSGNINMDGKTTYSGMGVRFTEISADSRQFISTLVEREFHQQPSLETPAF